MILILLLNILFGSVYEVFGDPLSTNWSIAYKSVHYITFCSMFMYVARKVENEEDNYKWVIKHSQFIAFMFNVFGVLYLSHAAIEMTLINESYYDYFDAMREEYFSTSQSLAVTIALSVYILIYKLKTKDVIYEFKRTK